MVTCEATWKKLRAPKACKREISHPNARLQPCFLKGVATHEKSNLHLGLMSNSLMRAAILCALEKSSRSCLPKRLEMRTIGK